VVGGHGDRAGGVGTEATGSLGPGRDLWPDRACVLLGTVPVPSITGEPVENTVYSSALLGHLTSTSGPVVMDSVTPVRTSRGVF
jgi:hypothetical protein